MPLPARLDPRRIAAAVRRALEYGQRWEDIESAIGSISETGHPWDPDAAAWTHAERRRDPRPVRETGFFTMESN